MNLLPRSRRRPTPPATHSLSLAAHAVAGDVDHDLVRLTVRCSDDPIAQFESACLHSDLEAILQAEAQAEHTVYVSPEVCASGRVCANHILHRSYDENKCLAATLLIEQLELEIALVELTIACNHAEHHTDPNHVELAAADAAVTAVQSQLRKPRQEPLELDGESGDGSGSGVDDSEGLPPTATLGEDSTTAESDTNAPTTSEPTTSEPTTAEPSTSEPTTSAPTTIEPTATESSAPPSTEPPTEVDGTFSPTSAPSPSEPTTSEPTTSEPTTSEPTTSEPTTSGPSPASTSGPSAVPSATPSEDAGGSGSGDADDAAATDVPSAAPSPVPSPAPSTAPTPTPSSEPTPATSPAPSPASALAETTVVPDTSTAAADDTTETALAETTVVPDTSTAAADDTTETETDVEDPGDTDSLASGSDESSDTVDLQTFAVASMAFGVLHLLLGVLRAAADKDGTRDHAHLGLSFGLAASHLVMGLAIDRGTLLGPSLSDDGCMMMAAVQHAFAVATFFWIGIHSFIQTALPDVGAAAHSTTAVGIYAIGWMFPSVFVILVLAIDSKVYGGPQQQTDM